MTAAWASQGQKRSKAYHHAHGGEPISWLHAPRIMKSDETENNNEFGRDKRLNDRQRPSTKRKDLKHESENHARNAQKPDGMPEKMLH